MDSELILHHYDFSSFSEKVRLVYTASVVSRTFKHEPSLQRQSRFNALIRAQACG
jgi:hypothetical protein